MNLKHDINGTICFHLAEQKNNESKPFAFIATYASVHNQGHSLSHTPLGNLLQNSSLESKKSLLLKLLLPIQKAAKQSPFLSSLIEKGDIFQPVAWTAEQAYLFLNDIPIFEQAGIKIRVPNWWNPKKSTKPQIEITIEKQTDGLAGLDSMLDFNIHLVLPDGEKLSTKEIQTLLLNQDKLVRIRGQWLELDNAKLQQVLGHWQRYIKNGISLTEGLRILAGLHATHDDQSGIQEEITTWSHVKPGPYLQKILSELRTSYQNIDQEIHSTLSKHLHAQLRPYQIQGVSWLCTLYHLQLGGCLADDMGLGKTIQVLALLILIQQKFPNKKHLLIIPTSLLGNWISEIKRFVPGLKYRIMHSSEAPIDSTQDIDVTGIDLAITTYGSCNRLPNLSKIDWDLLIIDEAQAIKNARSQQTLTIKNIKARVKFALTGTPVENSLLDLWSLFDFAAPGLLGSEKQFTQLSKYDNAEQQKHFHTTIQRLVSPYILRRLKSDKSIINDLPDKTEYLVRCNLTKSQALLYQQAIDELTSILNAGVDGIKRQGLVFSYLARLKQICNHPNQWLGHNQYAEMESGKFIELQNLCNIIAQRSERVLVFTQFREIIPMLSAVLTSQFGRPGLELHGSTTVKKRAELVAEFQKEDGPPFFILSLKAGGTGLNLTKASHVIHFDRWWNPAVENQATDRAYRIGQKQNVLVHKFICSGTIEEKIDEIIFRKRELADSIVKSGGEIALSNLSNTELLNMLSLDISRAMKEDEL